MKLLSHIQTFEKKHANATLFIGIAIGVGVGMYLFSLITPSSTGYMMKRHFEHKSAMHHDTMYGMDSKSVNHMTAMTNVTSEKNFLTQMITHHEDALRMAKEVLALPHGTYVDTLANAIITQQYAEIEGMKKALAEMK